MMRDPRKVMWAEACALLERAEQFVDFSSCQAPALVLYFDEHTLNAGTDPESHGGSRPSKLERVLQQVGHHCRQDLAVTTSWMVSRLAAPGT